MPDRYSANFNFQRDLVAGFLMQAATG